MATDNPTQLLTIAKGKILSDKPTTKDSLHYSDYVDILADAIRTCETPMTIGIHGEWGSGKTSLMLMLRDRLEDEGLKTVWFNAWKYDKEESLWRALILKILADLKIDEDDEEFEKTQRELYATVSTEEFGRMRLDWSELGKAVAGGVAKAALDLTLPVPISQALTLFQKIGSSFASDENVDALSKAIDRQIIKVTQQRMSAIDEFERKYEKLIERAVGQEGRLVVLIDDLDRCLPAKALEIFETLKTFLDAENCIYVVGCDRELVQKGLTEKYGDELSIDVQDYMEKIIQLPFDLPPLRDEDISNYVSELGLPKQVEEFVSIIVSGMEKNPRKMKRFVNSLSFQRALNEKRKLGLREETLIKCNCIVYRWREFWSDVAYNPALLRELEKIALMEELNEQARAKIEESSHLKTYFGNSSLMNFLRREPFFEDSDLSPYIHLMRTFETEEVSQREERHFTNPYVAGPPVTGAAFYGRADVFNFIKETLAAPRQNVIVLHGPRRSGKTSILRLLPNLLPSEDFHVVYFDLEGRGEQSLSEVLNDLAHAIATPLAIPVSETVQGEFTINHFQTAFLPQILTSLGKRRLVLLFDEFEALSDETWNEIAKKKGAAITDLFPYLRDLIAEQKQLIFVFAVGRSVEELPPYYKSIFKQAVLAHIFLLNRQEAILLITEPAKDQLQYDVAAIEAILYLTAAQPYFTQLICFELFNRMQQLRQKQVTIEDVYAVVERIIEIGTPSFVWLWEGFPIPERLILSTIAHITQENELATWEKINEVLDRYEVRRWGIEFTGALDRLLAWGLIRQEEQDNYSIVVEIVRQWVVMKHPPQEACKELEGTSEIATLSYRKAERLRGEGNLQQAIEEYRAALQLNPNHLSARLSLAQALYQQGEFVQAIDEYEEAFRFDQDSARDGLIEARLALAESLKREEAFKEAINHYRRVLELSPEDQRVREKLDALTKKVER